MREIVRVAQPTFLFKAPRQACHEAPAGNGGLENPYTCTWHDGPQARREQLPLHATSAISVHSRARLKRNCYEPVPMS
jgi:hypothetical protein